MRPFLALSALAFASLPVAFAHAAPPTDADVLRRLSQEFSDASATSDKATFDRLLDDDVTFMAEDGSLMTKQDLLASAAAAPNPHIHNHLEQRDFAVHFFGTTGVTSFTDVSALDYYGQRVAFTFRSTEVWKKRDRQWKMISSQTVQIAKAPPAVTLSDAELNETVGRYELAPDYVLSITRDGNALKGSVGQQSFPIEAEARDVLFTPAAPMQRRILLRDAAGRVTGMVSRRYGTDFVLKKVG